MREILFKGKREDNGEWVEGYLLSYEDGRARICERGTDIFCYERDDSIIQTVAHEVIPETVGQFTGLRDCKRTKEYPEGQMIFEGDIVTIPGSKRMGLPAEIWYNKLNTTFEIRRTGFNNISLFEAQEWCEIIGNIHDTEGGAE